MITVPLWLFAVVCVLAAAAVLSFATGFIGGLLRAQRLVDRILDDELGPRPDGDLTPPTNRQANRGQDTGAH